MFKKSKISIEKKVKKKFKKNKNKKKILIKLNFLNGFETCCKLKSIITNKKSIINAPMYTIKKIKVRISEEIEKSKKLHKIKLNKINNNVCIGFLLKKLKIKQKGIKNGIKLVKIEVVKDICEIKKNKKEPKK